MTRDPTPHPELPKAPPIAGGSPTWWSRLLGLPRPAVDVLLLKTRTCCLCDDALTLLERKRRRLGIRLRVHDISDSQALLERYGEEIPVVFVAGVQRFFGRVDPGLLAREVEVARRRSQARPPL